SARLRAAEGNPVVALPESGADNAHPGLEFDTRILNRVFFPGLVFDFHFGDGAHVTGIKPAQANKTGDRKAEDLIGNPVHLWYILAKGDQAKFEVHETFGRDGYEVVRIISSLRPGPVGVVIGVAPEKLSPEILPGLALKLAQFVASGNLG